MKSGASSKYPTMSLQQLKDLPIQKLIEKNSILFLWATVPLVQEALDLLKSWGFEYKTIVFWRKILSLGMGFWFRGQVEMLLVGIHGNVKAFRSQKPNFIQTKSEQHSRKPDKARALIDEIANKNFKEAKKIELFARNKRQQQQQQFISLDGYKSDWTFIGNEINNKDIKESIEEVLKL